ncbi:VOC family protein [Actinomycetes bacterium KLBMP 9759]
MTNSEFPGITPQLTVPDTDAAVRFYRAAFGADELLRNAGPDGRVFHCELLLFGGRLLLHDDFSERGETPQALGGSPVVLHLYTDDVDAAFATAVAAGATADMEPSDAFWGDRYAMVTDPFGHRWSLGSVREDLSVSELESRADTWAGEHVDTP